MATHSSILAWTEEPSRIQSIVSQTVRQDWSYLEPTHAKQTNKKHMDFEIRIVVTSREECWEMGEEVQMDDDDGN